MNLKLLLILLHNSNYLSLLYVVLASATFILGFTLWPRKTRLDIMESHVESNRKFATITIILLSLLIVSGGSVYYTYESGIIRNEKLRELNAIANLKINQIKQWQMERYSEARFFSTSEVVIRSTLNLMKSDTNNTVGVLHEYIEPITSFKRYENISIISESGKLLFSIHPEDEPGLTILHHLKLASEQDGIYFSDIFYCNIHKKILYVFIAPIKKNGQILAWLVFKSNPEGYLFPLIESWPIPSKSSETLILVKEGDSAVFKNRLKFHDNKDLSFKVPLSNENISAVAAVHGHRGYFEGVDYRGEEVISFIDTIPDSPWVMIAEIDKAEILAELYYRAVVILILCLVLILLCVAAVVMINRSRQKNIYQRLYQQEKELRKHQDEIFQLNKELEDRVKQRTAQLEMSNKELESFSYTVSHDLRAPLRHINAYVGLMGRMNAELPAKGQHYLKNIEESAKMMEVLIENLLKFSRTSRQEMKMSSVNMNEIVQEVINMEKDVINKRKIEWKYMDLPNAYCDSVLIRQVWYNLINNALKFSAEINPAIIEIGYRHDRENEITFYVKDNGVGFDMKYVHKIFDVFHRLHDDESIEGSGIGLATVKRIISKHGGTVNARSEIGFGSIFSFTLPKNEASGNQK